MLQIKAWLRAHSSIIALVFSVLISVFIFAFKSQLAHLQGYGLLGLFLLSILGNATIIFPAPVALIALVAGAVFNPLLSGIIISLGAAIGELTGYMAGYGGEHILKDDIKIQKVKKWMDKYGLWALFVFAAIPNPLFDVAGIIAGATGIPVYKYLLVVWAGKFIKFAVLAYIGAGSVSLLDKYL